MELLRAELTYRRGGRDLLNGALTLRSKERVGLVGRSGAGKTTLLRLLAGQLEPDEGALRRAPGVRLSLGQTPMRGTVKEAGLQALAHVRRLEATLRVEEQRLSAGEDRLAAYAALTERFEAAGGYGAEAGLERTLADFGFDLNDDRAVTVLSSGERAKLGLALALTERPDVLMLDEPSRYLDLVARRKLAQTLKAYPGALMFASHDRALLDAVCTHVVHLEAGGLTRYKGGVSSFRAQRSVAARTAQKRRKARTKEAAALQVSAARVQGRGTRAAAQQRREAERRLARLQLEDAPPRSATSRDLNLRAAPAKGTVLEARHLSKRYERAVVEDASLRVEAGDKVALVGPNGTGKSTLLQLLTGELASDHPEAALHYSRNAKVAVFDQETRGLVAEVPLLEQLTRLVSEPRAQMLLALVGLADVAAAPPERLSEGQKARAGLALVIASEANVLVLDEPTEGLDLGATEQLERALQDTDAAVLLVSHDAALVDNVATRVLSLEGGELTEYRGGLAGYLRGTRRLEPDLPVLEPEPSREEAVVDEVERLEAARLELEEAHLHAYTLTERERERLERRYRAVLDELFEAYAARFYVPAPLYTLREGAVTLEVDRKNPDAHYTLTSNAGLRARLLQQGTLGHLALCASEICTLPWAQHAVLRLAARVAFEHSDIRVLQLQWDGDTSAAGFADAGGGWWVLSRQRYEVTQGYVRG